MTDVETLEIWWQKTADLLASNRIMVGEYRYTAPSLDTGDFGRKDYANQFLWDSCFHAAAWRWIDPDMAQDELLSLASRQVQDGPDAGMIPHCNYWRGGGEWLWHRPERSLITQPPLITAVALLVYERSQDIDFLDAIYGPMCAYHRWFERRRDPDGDHLVSLIHPWECGGDALPRWDGPMQLDHPTHEEGRTARHRLAEMVVQHDADPLALVRERWFHVELMDFNAIRAADMEALAEIARLLGKPDEAEMWQEKVDAVRAAFQEKMVIDGLPYDLDGLNERPIVQASAGQFMTLFGGLPTREQAEHLVRQLREPRFWTPFPVTTSPADANSFAPDTYWRGNVWPSVNWLIFRGLLRYGYDDMARELADRSFDLLKQSGFCEYYHPITGQGLGGTGFSWCAAFMDMIATTNEQTN